MSTNPLQESAPFDREVLILTLRDELCSSCRDLPPDIPADAHFRHDLGLDSLDLVEFIARIEAKFRVPVPDDAWEALASLERVADYVLERR